MLTFGLSRAVSEIDLAAVNDLHRNTPGRLSERALHGIRMVKVTV